MSDERGRKRIAVIIVIIAAALVCWFLTIDHHIDVEIEGEGTADPMDADVRHLGSIDIRISPAEGWIISSIEVDGEATESDEGVLRLERVVSDHKVHIVFTEIEDRHTLTVTSNDGGTVDPSGVTAYHDGEKVEISITPNDGFVIDDILLDGSSIGSINRITITMDSDHAVDVRFRGPVDYGTGVDPWVTITVDVDVIDTGADYGTVDPSGRVRVAYGGSLVVEIVLNPGYLVKSISANGKDLGKDLVFVIDRIEEDTDVLIVLSREAKLFDISASATGGGSIDPSGIITVSEGDSVNFTLKAETGYELSKLAVDGITVMTSGTVYVLSNVTADHTVRAEFSPKWKPPAVRLVSITLENTPTRCYVGDILQTEGMIVIAHYSDGASYPVTGYSCSPTSWYSAGQKQVTVTYNGVSCIFDVNVPLVTRIVISEMPSVTTFARGAELDLHGMEVTASYDDGSIRMVDAAHRPDKFDTAGKRTVELTYSEGQVTVGTTLEVTIVDEGGFKVYVESYSGTRVTNGAIESFYHLYSDRGLSGFPFDMSNIVPGISQTVKLRVENSTGIDTAACLFVSTLTGSSALAEQLLIACGPSTKTVKDAATGMFVDLGTIGPSGCILELTISFPHGPDNNDVMGESVGFEIGVFAGQENDRTR